MPAARWGLAAAAVLATGAAAAANVAVPVYRDDPGYARARLASHVVPVALAGAVVATVVWVVRARSPLVKVGAGLFGLLLAGYSAVTILGGGGTTFPDGDRPDERRPGGPRRATAEETTLAGLLLFGGLACAGVAARGWVTGSPAGETKTGRPPA